MFHLSEMDTARLHKSGRSFKNIVTLDSLKDQCHDHEELSIIFSDMLDLALRYTGSVCEWQRIIDVDGSKFDEDGVRENIEKVRTSVHTAFIEQVNILSRMMARYGKSNAWRSLIGEDRAALGRFALAISFEHIKKIEGGGS